MLNNNSVDTANQPNENIVKTEKTNEGNESQIEVPVKFNKEIINLPLEKAQELAQKGMKFDMISADYEALKNLAKQSGKNVGEFIAELNNAAHERRLAEVTEKCGGDNEFAEHIVKLENADGGDIRGFDEVKGNFKDIKSIEDLPESVVEAAKLKGTLLLDEYLRYLHNQKKVVDESIKKQNDAKETAVGRFVKNTDGENPEAAEFLRGLWRK